MPTKAFVITLPDEHSQQQAKILQLSASIDIEIFPATTEKDVVKEFKERRIQWNYPWTTGVLDIQTGLFKSPYQTRVPQKRMACFMSHYRLWEIALKEPLFIFEQDAIFTRPFDEEEVTNSSFDIVSLNDPRGATRRAAAYHELIFGDKIVEAPSIDDDRIPQGLPGNSAYYITPDGAWKLKKLVERYGAWPNDAIMCKQLMRKKLGCLGNYATSLQKDHDSTTTK